MHRKTLLSMLQFLETEIWPHVPAEVRGKQLPKDECERILGYGAGGYCETEIDGSDFSLTEIDTL